MYIGALIYRVVFEIFEKVSEAIVSETFLVFIFIFIYFKERKK